MFLHMPMALGAPLRPAAVAKAVVHVATLAGFVKIGVQGPRNPASSLNLSCFVGLVPGFPQQFGVLHPAIFVPRPVIRHQEVCRLRQNHALWRISVQSFLFRFSFRSALRKRSCLKWGK